MKTVKSKIQKNKAKKTARKQIEKTLTERFLAVANDLGHNAEVIAKDITKASKQIARKLAKEFNDAKAAVTEKIEAVTAKKPVDKKLPKAVKKVQKEVMKVAAKVKPVGSVKVKPIKTEKKVEKVLAAKPAVKASAKPAVKAAAVVRTPAKPAPKATAKPASAKAPAAKKPAATKK